jgi:hypothetical protein
MKAKEKQAKGDGELLKTIFLRLDPTPDIIVISAIYFVEGTLGLARLMQTFLFKDKLHLSPTEIYVTMGIMTLPWTIKPLYGFLSDGFPIEHCGLTLNRRSLSSFNVSFLEWSFPSLPVAGSNHICLNVDISPY